MTDIEKAIMLAYYIYHCQVMHKTS